MGDILYVPRKDPVERPRKDPGKDERLRLFEQQSTSRQRPPPQISTVRIEIGGTTRSWQAPGRFQAGYLALGGDQKRHRHPNFFAFPPWQSIPESCPKPLFNPAFINTSPSH
jgi:hypothetical protein